MRNDSVKFLIGITEENNLVFANVEYRNNHFSACFDEEEPFEYDEDRARELIDDMVDDFDTETKWDICEKTDSRPSELAQAYIKLSGTPLVEIAYDISCYPYEMDIDDKEIYCQSVAGGQHDTRDILKKYPYGKEVANYVFKMWDEYHLKEISEEKVTEIFNHIYSSLKGIDEEKYIENFFKEIFE